MRRNLPRDRSLSMEMLESRRLLTGLAQSQLFHYLLNEARHDPPAYQLASGANADLSSVQARQPLALHPSLVNSAQFHSTEMATHDYFDHQSHVTGQFPNANARSHGYDLVSWWDSDKNYIESIAGGYPTAAAALKGLIESPGHRTHLLGIDAFYADNVDGAVGYALDSSSTYWYYWTVHLARTDTPSTNLTGVVFNDVNNNGGYDLNEGLGNIPVQIGANQPVTNAAGGWSLQVAPNMTHQVDVQVNGTTITRSVAVAQQNRQLDVSSNTSTTRLDFGTWQIPSASVVASHVYHAGSAFDLPGNLSGALDGAKQLAREGSVGLKLGLNHLINSTRGINGLVFDVLNLPASTLTAADFQFQISPQGAFLEAVNLPVNWSAAPDPTTISVLPGGTPRVVLKWPDQSIMNRWLRVTIKANANTGLTQPEVYYLGHLQGETTGPDSDRFTILVADILQIRSALSTSAGVSSVVDVDKSGVVLVADILAARSLLSQQLTQITIPPMDGGGGGGSLNENLEESLVDLAMRLESGLGSQVALASATYAATVDQLLEEWLSPTKRRRGRR